MLADAFIAAVKARDPSRIGESLAPDVKFYSPVVFKAYEGRDLVSTILTEGAMKIFGDDFAYVHHSENDGSAALIFRTTVAGRQVEGLDLLTFSPDGLVAELRVMIRPKSALLAVEAEMAKRFAALGLAPPA